MSSNSQTTSGGISLFGLIFLVLLIFKLAGIGEVANWSWWLITLPLWGPTTIVVLIVVCVGIVSIIKQRKNHKRFRQRFGLDSPIPPKKSNFQQRLEDMEAKRKALKNKDK
jgi:hypothetical protein